VDLEVVRTHQVTIETKVWERDWEFVLEKSRLAALMERCHYSFHHKTLMINNFKDYSAVIKRAEILVQDGIIDQFFLVEDYASKALDFFHIDFDSFGSGYVYSIAELVSIYLCRTEYLLHFSGDSLPCAEAKGDWLVKCIDALNSDPNLKVANLTWNHQYSAAWRESIKTDTDFFIGYGFSDQMYLIRTCDFRAQIYNETNAASSRYPAYGGNLFERRVDSWMRNNEFLRATYRHSSYIHKNFPRNFFQKLLWRPN
jgi:hypothetical protein